MDALYEFSPGTIPLLVSLPHPSSHIPAPIRERMTDAARPCPDRDREVDKLYDFAGSIGASVLCATHARYVIDLNRAPDGVPLYGDRRNSELCPLTTFDDEPIYLPGETPDGSEIRERTERYWRPYHQKIAEELERLRDQHGIAILFDAHTIRSRVARFHDGLIPDLNLGTAYGQSAAGELEKRAAAILSGQEYSLAINGAFSGGFITRHYGAPGRNIHALQLELTWRLYLDEESGQYAPTRAARLKPLLRRLLAEITHWATENAPA